MENTIREILTVNQKIKAVHYAVFFLRNEVTEIRKSIEEVKSDIEKQLLIKRLLELENDLEMFEELNEKLS